jgi:hypothetical protein
MAFRGLFVSLVHTVLHSNDAEKQKLFFVTYPQYGTPTDLLSTVQESLRAAETQDNGPACMKLVGTFLLRWIENCPEGMEAAGPAALEVPLLIVRPASSSHPHTQTLRWIRS